MTTLSDTRSEFLDDPWQVEAARRRETADQAATAQAEWLPRIQALVEPPMPTDDFPAFLLDLPQFESLRAGILAAVEGQQDVGVLDELQRFVDLYRDWLVDDQPARESVD